MMLAMMPATADKVLALNTILPLRMVNAGTCLGNGSTSLVIKHTDSTNIFALPFTGGTTLFSSSLITSAPVLDINDKVARTTLN